MVMIIILIILQRRSDGHAVLAEGPFNPNRQVQEEVCLPFFCDAFQPELRVH